MGTKQIDLICNGCNEKFSRDLKKHKFNLKKRPDLHTFCSNACSLKYKKKGFVSLICDQCKEIFSRERQQYDKDVANNKNAGTFCSRSCSASYHNNQRIIAGFYTKGQRKAATCIDCGIQTLIGKSASLTVARCKDCRIKNEKEKAKTYKTDNPILNCEMCLGLIENPTNFKRFCGGCREKVNQARGRASAASQQRRSKNEIHFANLCIAHFQDVYCNEPIFKDKNGNGWDADVIIHDIKMAVMWNGIWHYKQISKTSSLKQIQSRDKIKHSVIKSNGYEVYIIKDMGKENPKFVEKEFKKFIKTLTPPY